MDTYVIIRLFVRLDRNKLYLNETLGKVKNKRIKQ